MLRVTGKDGGDFWIERLLELGCVILSSKEVCFGKDGEIFDRSCLLVRIREGVFREVRNCVKMQKKTDSQ